MLLTLFLIFFLIQVLHADEFPNLMNHIEVTWGYEVLTSKPNARQTMSIDGNVPSPILCGPFQTSGNDGKCELSYTYRYEPSPKTRSSGSGQ